ncbi:hypothetical protein BDZ94DRAFT_1207631 [Collybia nuda]|uniref:Uncharacterized protein n=1 Tax=Collybia nuda TaxID=64659 RepID=A0A9P6CK07_9AGAR|nr:hypothetical protein BDZ94DRAFT_1207631 [Collybia nuda]
MADSRFLPTSAIERPNGLAPFQEDDFAVVLGFKETTSTPLPRDEQDRLGSLHMHLARNRMFSEDRQNVIFAGFCASYMPSTVNNFINIPVGPLDAALGTQLNNAYFEMLVALQHSPYFFKYFRSSKPIAAAGKELPEILAQRIASFAPLWDRYIVQESRDPEEGHYTAAMGSSLQLLGSLLATFYKELDQRTIVSNETKDALEPWLKKWGQRYPNGFLGRVCARVWRILSREPSFRQEVLGVRRLTKNWDVCGLPACNAGTNLKACGRYVINSVETAPDPPVNF